VKKNFKRHVVIQPADQSIRLIPLTQGQNAIVDAADFEWLNQWNWFAYWSIAGKTFYARRCNRAEGVKLMHREILKITGNVQVDHRNHNTLDNRKLNLRPATKSQNAANKIGRTRLISPYKGVTLIPRCSTRKWRAKIQWLGKMYHIGVFPTPEEAHEAYKIKAKELHGEFASFT